MGLKSKDYKKVQKMAEEAMEMVADINDYINGRASERELRSYTAVSFATNNIFEVQDALGGEIEYSNWYEDKHCIGTLMVNGVTYVQYGLTKEKIDGRKGDVCYEA